MPVGVYLHKPHSNETKQKISATVSASMTPEKRQRIGDALRGSNAPWFVGQKIASSGHILIYKPEHLASNQNYIRRSHLVMEEILGRFLTKDEVVHHKNEINSDDRQENLELFSSMPEHSRYHAIKNGLGTHIRPKNQHIFTDAERQRSRRRS